jgi:hypothetical protein
VPIRTGVRGCPTNGHLRTDELSRCHALPSYPCCFRVGSRRATREWATLHVKHRGWPNWRRLRGDSGAARPRQVGLAPTRDLLEVQRPKSRRCCT